MSAIALPPSPAQVPRSLTALTSSYQMRATLAVLAVVLFFLLFAALVVGLGYLVWWSIIFPMSVINKFTILAKLGAIAGSAMLFIFTLKFAFKLKNHVPSNRMELHRKDQPQLFALVDAVCDATGAPRPRKVHADPDVNAYVAYTNTWLSLFLPVRKDLTIGMGLVAALDRSELKAVLAHEFGHFAQRSMRIGSYIHSANTIIHDLIYQRDKWDDLLDEWRSADLRLSFGAWLITPLVWTIRKTLGLFHLLLSRMHASLSREMEFNADKVAVRAAGSEAIISALWKLDHGQQAWNDTLNHTYLAAQKGLFVEDLYHHHDLALHRGAPIREKLLTSLPEDQLGGRRFFSTSARSAVGMYSSHPPNDQREDSAKQPFVACERDSASAWTLLDNATLVRTALTDLVYTSYLKTKPTQRVPADELEEFVRGEQEGADLLAAHHNTYENRFLQLPAAAELEQAVQDFQGDPKEAAVRLIDELAHLMAPVVDIQERMAQVQGMADGSSPETSLTYQEKTYGKKELQAAWDALQAAREAAFTGTLAKWDRAQCAAHLKLADQAGSGAELRDRYAQQRAITAVFLQVLNAGNTARHELQRLQANDQNTPDTIELAVNAINRQVEGVNEQVRALKDAPLVPLPNIGSVKERTDAIVSGGGLRKGSKLMFENNDFSRLMEDLDRTTAHCGRVERKNIVGILAMHSRLRGQEKG